MHGQNHIKSAVTYLLMVYSMMLSVHNIIL